MFADLYKISPEDHAKALAAFDALWSDLQKSESARIDERRANREAIAKANAKAVEPAKKGAKPAKPAEPPKPLPPPVLVDLHYVNGVAVTAEERWKARPAKARHNRGSKAHSFKPKSRRR